MSDTSFEHHGHQVAISVWPTGDRWRWSFQIDDRPPVESRDAGARSEEEALIESRHEAIAAIKDLNAGP